MTVLRSCWCKSAVLVLSLLLLTVMSIEARGELVYPTSSGNPEGFVASFFPGYDEPVPVPKHPPIGEIPPIPMPTEETGLSNPEGPRTVIAYNAETGETREYPLVRASGQIGEWVNRAIRELGT